jgi:hypothetical protein
MPEKRMLTNEAVVNDIDAERVEIRVTLKEGVGTVSSLIIERVVAKWLAENAMRWAEYCIETGAKTV